MQIKGLDHMVLTVADIEITCDFYNRVLGMEVVTFGDSRKGLRFGSQKINLHRSGQEIQPCAGRPTPGSADLCFIIDTPVQQIIEQLQKHDIVVELGPVERDGARGPLLSIYIRDPDNNLIELSNDLSPDRSVAI